MQLLCTRQERHQQGLSSVKVGRRTYVRAMAPRKATVGKKHVRRRVATVKDTTKLICRGDSKAITQVEDRLHAQLQPRGSVDLQIFRYGTMQLKTQMVLSNWQLTTMRQLRREWGGGCLDSDRRVTAPQ